MYEQYTAKAAICPVSSVQMLDTRVSVNFAPMQVSIDAICIPAHMLEQTYKLL